MRGVDVLVGLGAVGVAGAWLALLPAAGCATDYAEADVRRALLQELAEDGVGTAVPLDDLVARVTERLAPCGPDLEPIAGARTTRFERMVRRLDNRDAYGTSLETRGLATFDAEARTWTLTRRGARAARR